jgi:GxxExxY protein
MPITCPISLLSIDPKQFAELDYRVTGSAFDSQNQLGRLCDEVIYRNDLADRLQSIGLLVRHEVPVTVGYRDFAKTYWMDLLVGDSTIYELKAESRLSPEHDAQLLNYMFLCGTHHGKLLNFRPPQVEARFLNTSLTPEARREYKIEMQRWQESVGASQLMREILLEILADWGAFLEVSLYLEALVHFLGGEEMVVKRMELSREGVVLGSQRFHLLSPEMGFRLTALAGSTAEYETQLQALLEHSPLSVLQWVNLGRHRIQFVTLTK